MAAKKQTARAQGTTVNLGGPLQAGNASHRWVQQVKTDRGTRAGQAVCGLGVA